MKPIPMRESTAILCTLHILESIAQRVKSNSAELTGPGGAMSTFIASWVLQDIGAQNEESQTITQENTVNQALLELF